MKQKKKKICLKKLPNTKESIMPGGSKLYASQFIEFFGSEKQQLTGGGKNN